MDSATTSTSTNSDRWTKNVTNEVTNIVITGGVHGNELHGLFLVDEINTVAKAKDLKEQYPSLSIWAIVGNINASKAIGTGAGRRYIDIDLNRCFLLKDLEDMSINNNEGLRAKELDELLGPKRANDPKTDLILDFHSTTSNTGVLLCCHREDKFSWEIIAHLQALHPSISASLWSTGEVGPIAHSTTNSKLYQQTKIILNDALSYVEMHNKSISKSLHNDYKNDIIVQKPAKLVLYERFATVGFPRNSQGNITALIHERLQGASELQGNTRITLGSPIFQVMANNAAVNYITYDENGVYDYPYRIEYAAEDTTTDVLFPMFINEAAYNEKDVAFVLMRKLEKNILVASKV